MMNISRMYDVLRNKGLVNIKKAFNLIVVLCLFVASLLVLGTSIVTTIYYDYGVDVDFPHYQKENVLLLLLLVTGVVFVFALLKKIGALEKNKGALAFGIVFCLAYCLLLILAIRPYPVNDSKTLDDIIGQFMVENYSSLTEKGGYLFIWPFQLGYVAFGQLMSSIFGTGNYLAWDLVQLLSIVITVYLLYKLTWEFFGDRQVCSIMAFLSAGMLFFYNYVTYIYGDILSMAPQTIALFLVVLYMKRKRVIYGFGAGVAIAVAVMLKTNCEIALIALLMALLLDLISQSGKTELGSLAKSALIILVMLVLTFSVKSAVDAYYCSVTGLDEIPGGSPSVSHIAMGLQESELEDGWYNGYNYQVFEENDYDIEATKAAAIANIKETLTGFVKRPLHGGRFLVRKFLTQWADPVCVSTHNLDLVNRHHDNTSAIADSIVSGGGSVLISQVMNVYMTVCYLGVAIYLFGILKKKEVSDSEMLLLILIFGGIVFHEFWEGSSRYAMRYYVYWVPFAAKGISMILESRIFRKFLKK